MANCFILCSSCFALLFSSFRPDLHGLMISLSLSVHLSLCESDSVIEMQRVALSGRLCNWAVIRLMLCGIGLCECAHYTLSWEMLSWSHWSISEKNGLCGGEREVMARPTHTLPKYFTKWNFRTGQWTLAKRLQDILSLWQNMSLDICVFEKFIFMY